MVLAKEYAFEAKRLVTNPQVEVAHEECCYIASIGLHAWAAQFGQELKYPWFDHCKLLARLVAAVCAPLLDKHVDRSASEMC
jgi:hypothetical protein